MSVYVQKVQRRKEAVLPPSLCELCVCVCVHAPCVANEEANDLCVTAGCWQEGGLGQGGAIRIFTLHIKRNDTKKRQVEKKQKHNALEVEVNCSCSNHKQLNCWIHPFEGSCNCTQWQIRFFFLPIPDSSESSAWLTVQWKAPAEINMFSPVFTASSLEERQKRAGPWGRSQHVAGGGR